MPDYLVDFPGLGIFDIPINRTIVEFDLFGRQFSIYWYGVIIALAFLVCIFLSMRHAPEFGMTRDQIVDYYLLIIPLALIGARLYYVAFEWDSFRGNLGRILDLRTGGLAFYGGVIGGVLAIVIMAAVKKHKLSRIFDFIAVYLPLGHAIGRWGNFFNQEAFGVNTDLPWGMYSNGTQEYLSSLSMSIRRMMPNLDPSKPVHPTFLYEFIANIIIFIILLQVRKRSKRPFTTVAGYFLMYGLVRFLVEGLRTDALYFTGTDIRVSQLLSALMIIASLIYLIISGMIKQRHPEREVTVAIPATILSEAELSETEIAVTEGSATDTETDDSKKEDAETEDSSQVDAETEDFRAEGSSQADAETEESKPEDTLTEKIGTEEGHAAEKTNSENANDTIFEEGVIHVSAPEDKPEQNLNN